VLILPKPDPRPRPDASAAESADAKRDASSYHESLKQASTYLIVGELAQLDRQLSIEDFAVALARDWETNQIFTLDETDFRRLAPLPGSDPGFGYFRILPTDL
jgi:hypothetical protein